MKPTSIAGVDLCHPIYNAASPLTATHEGMDEIRQTAWSSAVLTKTVTVAPTDGHCGRIYAPVEDRFSLNSYGLRNPGLFYYNQYADGVGKSPKPLFLSLEADSALQFPELSRNFDLIELNVSCPNQQRPAYAEDASMLRHFLRRYFEGDYWEHCPVGLKLAYVGSQYKVTEICDVLKDFPKVRFVTAINAVPCGMDFTPTMDTVLYVEGGRQLTDHLGGVSGRAILPLALGTVAVLCRELGSKCDVVGCGGISSEHDVRKFIEVGAKAVQMYTEVSLGV